MSPAHGRWAAELSTFETHAKAWLAVAFGVPPAAVLAALEGAGVSLPTWATALLAVLPIVTATAGVTWGPANKDGADTVKIQPGMSVMYPPPDVPVPPLNAAPSAADPVLAPIPVDVPPVDGTPPTA